MTLIQRNHHAAVEIWDLAKSYGGGSYALEDVSLTIARGEFVSILGQSGSGKSTLLRSIAGLVTPSHGEIELDGRVVFSSKTAVNVPARRRDVGLVFQSFALWPHMTVAENIGFALKLRKWRRPAIAERVEQLLELVSLRGLGARHPSELSGGQQQRVALARSIAYEPAVLLLDEPLSSLDAELRLAMRTYLKSFQRKVGITAVYVTHDREEALALGDKVIVLENARTLQIGTPEDLVARPASVRVAEFLTAANVIPVTIEKTSAGRRVTDRASGTALWDGLEAPEASNAMVAVSPEEVAVALLDPTDSRNGDGLTGVVTSSEFLGDSRRIAVKLDHMDIEVFSRAPVSGASAVPAMNPGDAVEVSVGHHRWFSDDGVPLGATSP